MRGRAVRVGLVALCAAAVLGASPRAHDDGDEPMTPREVRRAMKEMAKPGPEHERLESLVGRFRFRAYFRLTPDDTPESAHGVAETSWILGKRFLEQRMRGRRATKSFEGLLVFGYDSYQRHYAGSWVDESDPGITRMTGDLQEDGKTIRLQLVSNDPRFEGRKRTSGALVLESEDRFVLRFEEEHPETGEPVEMAVITFERDE